MKVHGRTIEYIANFGGTLFMSKVQVNSEKPINLNEILDNVGKLDTPELEGFVLQVSTLLARRKAPSLSEREAKLLQKINRGLSADVQQRYSELSDKLEAETLNPEEHKELLDLIDRIEKSDAQRMKHLLELAQLRNLDVDTLIKDLGLQSSIDG